jgi:hypothetical protein
VAASLVVVALAQSGQDDQAVQSAAKRQGGHPPSRVVKAMCVHDGSKMLRYIKKPSRCNEEEEHALEFPEDGPKAACQVREASAARARNNAKRPWPDVRRGARVGSLFLAKNGDCRSGEKKTRLSPPNRKTFCVELHDGGTRVVGDWRRCKRFEFAAVMRPHKYSSTATARRARPRSTTTTRFTGARTASSTRWRPARPAPTSSATS